MTQAASAARKAPFQPAVQVALDGLSFTGILGLLLKSIVRDFRLPLAGLAAAALASAACQVAAPKVVQQLIDAAAGGALDRGALLNLVALGGAFFLGGAAFQFLADKLSFFIGTQVEDRWRFAVLNRYFQLPMRWQDQHDSGEIGAKMEQGAAGIFVVIYEIFGQNLVVSLITLAFVLAYSFHRFPLFGWILLAPVPLYVLATVYFSVRISDMQTKVNDLYHVAVRTFYDGVGNMRYVKTFGREGSETAFYAAQWTKFHQAEYQIERWWLSQSLAQKAIETCVRVVVLFFGVRAVLAKSLSLGELVMLLTFQQLTFAPLELIHRLFTRLRRVVKRVTHLMEIVAEPDALEDAAGAQELSDLRRSIEVEGLSFRYHRKLHALHDVSFKAKAGSTTAIVGRSGAGKSTLAMLLLRFYDPDAGAIRWDGLDLREATRASLRGRSTLILQDTSLFNRSIRDNIRYGLPEAGMKEVEAAARLAHAHEFILALPQGYDSVVGERGVRLSGGQRQRIAIARALLVRPRLLVMDEATSHLDSETEAAIQDALGFLRGKQTQIIIAHRLSTIQDADNILLMDKGRLLAQGTHKRLLKHPLYKKLCRLQFRR